MKKILILANNDIGLYKFRKELIAELVKDYQVFISLPNGEYIPLLEKLGCIYINTPINRRGTNPITDLKLLLKYKTIIKDVKPNVVLTYTIKPNIYGSFICRWLKIPSIVNITGLGSVVKNNGFLQKITLLLYKISLKKVFCVFFQNTENIEFFNNKKIEIKNYKLIPGSGVNLKQYYVLDYPSDEAIKFVFISRIMKQKGIDQYLETAEYIKNKYPNTEFHICGFCEEAYETKLNDYDNRGIIKYHGMVLDIKEILKKTHCTIHPTYYPEGMSNVLLESAACGRPIITTDRSGCREIVDDEINGYIVQEKNTQDNINKVEKFIKLDNETRKSMGLIGRKKVENEFNRKIVVDAYLKEIDKSLGGIKYGL